MNCLEAKTLEELKSLGDFKTVKTLVKEATAGKYKVAYKSWSSIFESICVIREANDQKVVPKIKEQKTNKSDKKKVTDTKKKENKSKSEKEKDTKVEIDNNYFISNAAEYIFYLLELDGEIRTRKLGITKTHYSNKKKAKAWRDKISKAIHPDKCRHEKAADAMSKLNSMYKSMVSDE